MEPSLKVNIAGIRMRNPVMVASGTFGYGDECGGKSGGPSVDLNKIGAIVVKGTTLKPRQGNPLPRMAETASGMLNAIGLQNVGVDAFIKEKLPFLRRFATPVIVNIGGDTIREYEELACRLDGVKGVAGLEINISCPNIPGKKLTFAQDAGKTYETVKAVRRKTRLPVIAKLAPNVTDITVIARAAEKAGADAVSLVNTFPALAIDIEKRCSKIANFTGGLSGPAIKPIALHLVWLVAKAVKIPVVGMGGIMNAEDALEFIMAGARACAVGTVNFIEPASAIQIAEDMKKWMKTRGIRKISSLAGTLKTK